VGGQPPILSLTPFSSEAEWGDEGDPLVLAVPNPSVPSVSSVVGFTEADLDQIIEAGRLS
jgi:hypothetical protein